MKRLICLVLTAIASLTLLCACGGDGGQGQSDTARFFDEGMEYYLFMDNSNSDSISDIIGAVSASSGVILKYRTPDYADSCEREIVFGDNARPASVAAKSYVDSLGLDEDTGIYLLYVHERSLAVYYNCDYARDRAIAYFIDVFVTSEAKDYEPGAVHSETFSISEVKGEAWEARWSSLEGKISDGAINAMKRLYGLFGEDTYMWIANLYDPELGAFYYSNDARDYQGFLPDVESTRQVLTFLLRMGMVEDFGNDLDIAVPDEIQDKMVSFVKSLQDPDDGYFYHVQWGKNINTSRRGRDLTWSIYILNQFGESADYKTPLDRLGDDELVAYNLTGRLGSSVSSAISGLACSSVSGVATNEEAPLDSWESLKAYLDKMDFANDSHAQGQILSAQSSVIAAAGYGKQVIEYMDSKQFAETGLWESTVSYRSIGGLLKISSAYSTLGGEIKYAEEAMNSCIEALLSDEPQSSMTCVYNCLNGMGNVMGNLKRHGGADIVAEVQSYLRGRAEEMISAATNKIAGFRKDDGSFSYKIDGTLSHSQGALVSLGNNEGDMNATLLATGSITGLYDVLGLEDVRVYSADDYQTFINALLSSRPIEKNATEPPEPVSFDDLGDDELPYYLERDELINDDLKIVDDPRGSGRVIALTTAKGQGDYFHMRLGTVSTLAASCYVLETDISFAGITENSNAEPLQLYMRSARASTKSTYMVTFNIKGDQVKLYDLSYGDSDGFRTDLLTSVSKDEWFKLRIEYYVEDPENVLIKVFVNDELKKISNNFFGPRGQYGAEQPAPNLDYLYATFYAVKSADGTMMFDNILMDKTDTKFTSEGYDGVIGGGTKDDFKDSFGVNGTEVITGELDFEDFDPEATLTVWTKSSPKAVTTYSSTGVERFSVVKGEDGNQYLAVNKTQSGAAVLSFKVADGEAGANCSIFEADIDWSYTKSGSGLQFALGDGTVYTCKTENSKAVSMFLPGKSTFGSHTAGNDQGGVKLDGALIDEAIKSGNKFTIRIEYYDDVKMAKLYVNGSLMIATDDIGGGASYDYAVIYLTNSFLGEVRVDNVSVTRISKAYDASEAVSAAPALAGDIVTKGD